MHTHTFEIRTEKNNNNNSNFTQQPNSSDGFAETNHSEKSSYWLIQTSWVKSAGGKKKEAFVHMAAPSTILEVSKI